MVNTFIILKKGFFSGGKGQDALHRDPHLSFKSLMTFIRDTSKVERRDVVFCRGSEGSSIRKKYPDCVQGSFTFDYKCCVVFCVPLYANDHRFGAMPCDQWNLSMRARFSRSGPIRTRRSA